MAKVIEKLQKYTKTGVESNNWDTFAILIFSAILTLRRLPYQKQANYVFTETDSNQVGLLTECGISQVS